MTALALGQEESVLTLSAVPQRSVAATVGDGFSHAHPIVEFVVVIAGQAGPTLRVVSQAEGTNGVAHSQLQKVPLDAPHALVVLVELGAPRVGELAGGHPEEEEQGEGVDQLGSFSG